jgi:hypothetical protein
MMFQHFMQNPISADAKVYFAFMSQQYAKQLQQNMASVERNNANATSFSSNAEEDPGVPLVERDEQDDAMSPDHNDNIGNLELNYDHGNATHCVGDLCDYVDEKPRFKTPLRLDSSSNDDDGNGFVLPPTQNLIAGLEQNRTMEGHVEDTQLTTLD